MPARAITLRPMRFADRPAALDLWVTAWQAAYPAIDFEARRAWMAERLDDHARQGAQCIVALSGDRMVGLLVIEVAAAYLEQIAVDREYLGRGIAETLLVEAKRLCPAGFGLHVNQDNARAIRFYKKHGLSTIGEDVNPRSGAPIYKMRWQP